MNILAFDSSTRTCSVAVAAGEAVRTDQGECGRSGETGLPGRIAKIMRAVDLDFCALDAVVYGRGPGSFIGVRTSVALAQGFACAFGRDRRKLIGVSSLATVAQSVLERHDAQQVLAVLDARQNESYYAYYERDAEGFAVLRGDEGVCALGDIPGVGGFNGACAGTGDKAALRTGGIRGFMHWTPDARAMLKLAQRQIQRREWLAPDEALPVYLRNRVV